jgi:ABC-type branched-subunit amino acid transport system substrate-binding protein
MRLPVAALAPLVTSLVLAACGRDPPVLLGYAYARGSPNVADVAQEALDRAAGGGPAIRIARWPVGVGGVDLEIRGATLFAETPGMVGVVGHSGSRETLLGAPVYHSAGIPLLVPTSTSRRLSELGPWTFRLAPNDSVEGDVLAAFVTGSLGARSATIFYFSDEYGVGLRDGVASGLARRGGTVLDEVSVNMGSCPPLTSQDDFATVVGASLQRATPDVVILAGRRVDGGCVMRIVDSAHPAMPFVAGDGIESASPQLREIAGSAVDRLHSVVFWRGTRSDTATREFIQRFQRIVGRAPDDTDAMVYDAFMLLGQAVREAGADRAAVRRWLESLGGSRAPWQGVTGPVSFRGERRHVIHVIRYAGAPADVP